MQNQYLLVLSSESKQCDRDAQKKMLEMKTILLNDLLTGQFIQSESFSWMITFGDMAKKNGTEHDTIMRVFGSKYL